MTADRATGSGAELLADLKLLEMLDDENLLSERLQRYLENRRALARDLDKALAEFRDPSKRKRPPTTRTLPDEPLEKTDQLAIFVLSDELGSTPATVPTTIGTSGVGERAIRWVWQPPGLGFIARADFSTVKLDPPVRKRVVELDPGRSKVTPFNDLFGLVASSKSNVHMVHDVCRSIIRGTSSLYLLELWFREKSTRDDPQRARLVRERIKIVERQSAAAE